MHTQLIIDNKEVPSVTGKIFEKRSPITGHIVSTGAAANVEDALTIADSSLKAFKAWSASTPTERRALLLRAADLIDSKVEKFIETMAAEVGASQLWAGFNVAAASNIFREAASLATQIQGVTLPTDKPNSLSMTIRQPVGPCLSIVPWNGPIILAARAIAYPLVCGNSVIFRASEVSPMTHRLIADAVYEAGLPAGVLNFITTAAEDAPEVIDALIAHPAVRRINFTGSTAVGRIIALKAMFARARR